MAIRGAKLTFGGGKNVLGVQKLQGAQQAYKKNQKKIGELFFFFLFFGDTRQLLAIDVIIPGIGI